MHRHPFLIYSEKDEFYISDILKSVAAAHTDVNIGSYPDLTHRLRNLFNRTSNKFNGKYMTGFFLGDLLHHQLFHNTEFDTYNKLATYNKPTTHAMQSRWEI